MGRFKVKKQKPGTAPGTLVAPEGAESPRVTVMAYDENELIEKELRDPADIAPLLKKWKVVWVNVDGLGSVETIEKIGDVFDLHPLALEDVLDTTHRPKTEDYDDYLFIVARMIAWRDDRLDSEQLSLFFGRKFVLTFQERPGDGFEAVRARIRSGKNRRMRILHADYLAYALIDATIDGYFPVLERIGERLNQIEDDIVENPSHNLIGKTHDLKRDLQTLRHNVWPMREMVNAFAGGGSDLVRGDTQPFLRDCYDHVIQVLDLLETYRERASSLIDIYLSSISKKMNEVMQILTIIATIFIPLTFITGLYGMNFDVNASPWNMPELGWRFGYPFALGLMVLIAGGLLLYFRRKGWLKL